MKTTKKAEEFVRANAESPVVIGEVLGPNGGARYTLDDGRRFTLSVEDCKSMPHPRWDLPS